ncbi:MAG: NAD(P)-dependent oxidoreductase [Candidatus Pacebacteria bacterium]|nr:NAD(P)-dependent oxidoreductase [Candidatus Paceibacterota bacterium]
MKKLLITGPTGFLGSHIVGQAQKRGYEVHVIAHKQVALEDRSAVEKLLQTVKPDAVIHPATSTLMSGKTADPHTLIATNVEGAAHLMDAAVAVGVKAFINIGSIAEYGPKDHPVKESELCEPGELYAVTKLAATTYGQSLARRTGFPFMSFRLTTPYGPRIQAGRLVRVLIEKIKSGERIPLSSPETSRDYVFVEDVPPLLFEALEKAGQYKGEIFNLGSGERTTIVELVETLETMLGKKAQPEWGAFPLQSYDSNLWQADMAKTFSAFTWRPAVALHEGMQKTAETISV